MKALHHHIYKQVIDINAGDEETVREMQERWSILSNNELAVMMDALFSRLFPGDRVVKIKELSIDVGRLDNDLTNAQWAEIICNKLEEQLLKYTYSQSDYVETLNTVTDESLIRHRDEMATLVAYLKTGVLNYPAKEVPDIYLQTFASRLYAQNPAQFLKAIVAVINLQAVSKRLAYFFGGNVLEGVIQAIAPEHSANVPGLIDQLSATYNKPEIYLSLLNRLVIDRAVGFEVLADDVRQSLSLKIKRLVPVVEKDKPVITEQPNNIEVKPEHITANNEIEPGEERKQVVASPDKAKSATADTTSETGKLVIDKSDSLEVLEDNARQSLQLKGEKEEPGQTTAANGLEQAEGRKQAVTTPDKDKSTDADATTETAEREQFQNSNLQLSAEDQRFLNAIKKAIKREVTDKGLQVAFSELVADFVKQVYNSPASNAVEILQGLVRRYSGLAGIKFDTFLKRLDKAISATPAKHKTHLFFDVLYILNKTISAKAKKPKPDETGFKKEAKALIYYLEHFKWPHSFSKGERIKYLRRLGGKFPSKVREAMLKQLRNPVAIDALADNASARLLLQIAQLIHPENNRIKYQVTKAFQWLVLKDDAAYPSRLFWLKTLTYLMHNTGFNAVNYVKYLSSSVAAETTIEEVFFIKEQLRQLSKNEPKKLKLIAASLRIIKRQEAFLTLITQENAAKPEDAVDQPIKENIEGKQVVLSEDVNESPAEKSLQIIEKISTNEGPANPEKLPKITTKKDDELEHHSKNAPPTTEDTDADEYDDDVLDDESIGDDEVADMATNTELFINNAGLVILYPFISVYLERLNILQDGKLKTRAAKLKAINALQYLVTGVDYPNEFDLVLNKLLCGLAVWDVYEPQQPLTDEQKEIAESLLTHIIAQWKTIGNTSIEGLRESFLQRNGKLLFNEDAIYLQVETRVFDMLLDTLPWSIAMLKFSWMDKPLHALWR